jgi:GNAT superfamily N-acetyltransferase
VRTTRQYGIFASLLINKTREMSQRHVRDMTEADVPAVARLLEVLAREYIVHTMAPEAASTFLRDNNGDALRRLVEQGYVYHVAEVAGTIQGFIGVRDKCHLYHLFVAKAGHGKGIARTLWEHARGVAGSRSFTVNASNFAVPVYEAFGFVRVAPMQCVNGLEFNPMLYGESVPPLVGAA